jgi:hypothetical protein
MLMEPPDRYNLAVPGGGSGGLVVADGGGRGWGVTSPQISATIHAYPSLSEISRALGDAYQRTRLSPGTKGRLERAFAWFR